MPQPNDEYQRWVADALGVGRQWPHDELLEPGLQVEEEGSRGRIAAEMAFAWNFILKAASWYAAGVVRTLRGPLAEKKLPPSRSMHPEEICGTRRVGRRLAHYVTWISTERTPPVHRCTDHQPSSIVIPGSCSCRAEIDLGYGDGILDMQRTVDALLKCLEPLLEGVDLFLTVRGPPYSSCEKINIEKRVRRTAALLTKHVPRGSDEILEVRDRYTPSRERRCLEDKVEMWDMAATRSMMAESCKICCSTA
ncbi:hypothetical protein B0H10DRAFT_2183352 [Mycena sp. CBHHK59/15]|nr:hypothetical protein B0H10DRAFT_2183352 [Mycena sp. CBHHK59/15]